MSRSFKPVSVFLMMLVCLELRGRLDQVCGAPTCAYGQTGCQVLSLSDLFERVIQHSARIHGISSDLHSEFERYLLPSRNHIGRVNRHCHTSSILTPTGKENAQRLTRAELAEVILKLLVAWRNPLWQFHQNIAHQHDLNKFSSNKVLEMSDMVHELRKGVEKVAEKMQHLGMMSNSLSALSSPEALVPSSAGAESRPMSEHDLLFCFRRDSNKVQNYLKILKCGIVPEHGC